VQRQSTLAKPDRVEAELIARLMAFRPEVERKTARSEGFDDQAQAARRDAQKRAAAGQSEPEERHGRPGRGFDRRAAGAPDLGGRREDREPSCERSRAGGDREKAIDKLTGKLSRSANPVQTLSGCGFFGRFVKLKGKARLEVDEDKIKEAA